MSTKKISFFVNAILSVLSFLFLQVQTCRAQQPQIMGDGGAVVLGFNMPSTTIQVKSSVDDNTQAVVKIQEKQLSGTLTRGGAAMGYKYRWDSFNRDVTFDISVCTGMSAKHIEVQLPPSWLQDPLFVRNNPLTNDYLKTNPDEKDLEARVKQLKHEINRQPGHKEKEKELDAWLKRVKREGVVANAPTCEGPAKIFNLVFRSRDWYNYYTQSGNTISEVILRGSKAKGYHLDTPSYIYVTSY